MLKLFRQAKLGKMTVFALVIFTTLQVVGTMYLPRLTADIINYGVVMQDRDFVFRTGAIMIGVAVATGLFSILGTYFSAEVATRFARNTRRKLLRHTQSLSYQDFRYFNTSSLITRSTNDVEQLQSTLSMFFDMMLPAPFIVIAGLVLSFQRDPIMALIILISTVVFLIVAGVIFRIVFPYFARVQKGLDKINASVGQYISGIRVVRAFNRTKLEGERMSESFHNLAKINIKINRLFATVMPLVYLALSLATVAIVWFGAIRIESGDLQIGDIMAIMKYSMNILFYLLAAVFVLIFIPRAKVCAARIREVLDYTPEISDGDSRISKSDDVILEFKDVGFRYHDAENPVLHNLNFTCKRGTTTAIIGGTGSGKSTIARLIPRLLDTSSGQILLNGTDIKNVPQENLREKVGFVPQKAFLFSGTIAIDFSRLAEFVLLLTGLYAASSLAQFFQERLMADVSQKLTLSLRERLGKKLSKVPLKFYDNHKKGEILSRVTNDLERVNEILSAGIMRLFTSIIIIIGALILMFRIDWILTLIAIGAIFIGLIATAIISAKSNEYFTNRQRSMGKFNARIEENFSGHVEIKTFNLAQEVTKQTNVDIEQLYKDDKKAQFIMFAIMPIIRLFNQVGYVAIAAVGASFVISGRIPIGQILALFQYELAPLSRHFFQKVK